MSRYNWAAYQSANHCEGHAEPGAVALMKYLLEVCDRCYSLGIYSCRNVRGGSTMSHHAEGRAYDNGVPTESDGSAIPAIGDPIVELLGPHGDRLGIDHLIWNRQIWSRRSPDGRYYSGTHPHYNHHHIGLTRNSAANLTYATLVAVLGPPSDHGHDHQEDTLLPLIFGHGYNTPPTGSPLTGNQSHKREDVKHLQKLLGITVDGYYGTGTKTAVGARFNTDGTSVGGEEYTELVSGRTPTISLDVEKVDVVKGVRLS